MTTKPPAVTVFRFGRHGWLAVDAPSPAPARLFDIAERRLETGARRGEPKCSAPVAGVRRAALLIALAACLPPEARATDIRPGSVSEGVACAADPSKTYSLYLPSGYTPDRRWPALLIFPPGGRSANAVEIFRPAAERHGWIVLASDDTRSGGVSMEVNARAVRAMGGELGTRWSVDMKRVYAAGFSGGAMVAWLVGAEPGLVAGVIACGGIFLEDYFSRAMTYAHFGAVGTRDFNNREMRAVDRRLAELGALHRLEFFDGPHSWLPAAVAAEAVEWMELVAMQRGLRPRDDALVAAALAAETARAARDEHDGRPLQALRRFETIAATFAGLADASAAGVEAKRLARSAEVRQALREEGRNDRFEEDRIASARRVLTRLRGMEEPMPLGRLITDLGVAGLEKTAAKGDAHALAAQRVLQSLLFHLTTQVATDLREARRFRDYASVMAVAARIEPGNPFIAYNLACSHALAGDAAEAIAAIERAVELGFKDGALLASDTDLDTLRGDDRFAAILARVGRDVRGDPVFSRGSRP